MKDLIYIYVYYFYFTYVIWFLKWGFRQQNTQTADRWGSVWTRPSGGKVILQQCSAVKIWNHLFCKHNYSLKCLYVHQVHLCNKLPSWRKTQSGHGGTYHGEPLFIWICRKGIYNVFIMSNEGAIFKWFFYSIIFFRYLTKSSKQRHTALTDAGPLLVVMPCPIH